MRPTRIALLAAVVACSPAHDAPARVSAAPDTTPRRVVHAFPRVGVAVRDSAGDWCAEFIIDSAATPLRVGDHAAIVFPGGAGIASLDARVMGPHVGQCHAEFAQPRWNDYASYRVELTSKPAGGAEMADVALIVAGAAKWTRDADGVARADLDSDGVREEARRCLADEGEHFTIWSPGADNTRVRRWHEYYDWGALTDANCKPGEAGEAGQ